MTRARPSLRRQAKRAWRLTASDAAWGFDEATLYWLPRCARLEDPEAAARVVWRRMRWSAANRRRNQGRRQRLTDAYAAHVATLTEPPLAPDVTQERALAGDAVRQAICGLTPPAASAVSTEVYQTLAWCVFGEGSSVAVVAAEVGLSESTAWRLLATAKADLAAALQGWR